MKLAGFHFHTARAGVRLEAAVRRQVRSPRNDIGRIVNTVRTEGLVVLERFFEPESVASMLSAVPEIQTCRLSPEGTLTRFDDTAWKLPGLAPFFEHAQLESILRRLVGRNSIRHRAVAQHREHHGPNGSFEQFFHIDTWRLRYKCFLYLTDVTADTGPLVYLPKSHYGMWRNQVEFLMWRHHKVSHDSYIYDDRSAYVGCLWPHEVEEISARRHLSQVSVVAPAGSVVIFDARGLHRAEPLNVDRRIVLYTHWIRKGKHT